MFPGNYNLEWLKYKDGEPMEETPKLGSVARAWQWRERGVNPPNQPPNKTVLENIAEDILVQKPLQITSCDLPGFPRSTFLMVFSPDGTKLASTHGNHNIYVSELASGKHVRILRGHPRTPWCIAFHPSHPQLIGSGCLGGQVRVWDIASGGSEVWNVYNETVIASIAFHPREQLLVIATYNELYFWDWSQPAPFTKVSTRNINEKVRYVAFDSLGFKLITGISLWACSTNTPLATPQNGGPNSANNSRGNGSSGNNNPGNSGNDDPGNGGPGTGPNNPGGDSQPRLIAMGPDRPQSPDTPPLPPQDLIVNSYQNLVQRYDSLVRNYQRLFMVRHRLINTPPLANTIDRGTDPMETYPPISGRHRRRSVRRLGRSSTADSDNLTISFEPGTSQQQESPVNNTAAPTPRPGFITMDSSPSDSATTRNTPGTAPLGFRVPMPGLRHIGFASAFQPLGDERTTRLLPNPFSSTNSDRQPNSSRTSGLFVAPDASSDPPRRFPAESRPPTSEENAQNPPRATRSSRTTERTLPPPTLQNLRDFLERAPPLTMLAEGYAPPPLPTEPPPANPPPPPDPAPDSATSRTSTTRNTYTRGYTRNADEPLDPTEEAQTINESLDLIRDILRDSGTRLLNLITNMSMNILHNSERAESARVPVHVFTGNLRRDFMASSSSDTDNEYPEVNITRTPNATFRGWDNELIELNSLSGTDTANRPRRNSTGPQISDRMTFEIEPPSETPSRQGGINISNRMTFELDEASEVPSREGGINVSLSGDRFRVRTQGSWAAQPTQDVSPSAPAMTDPKPGPSREPAPPPAPCTAARDEPQPGPSSAPDPPDPSQPSTSKGNARPRNSDVSAQAFRRVKMGVYTLQKHTLLLANMWLRGDRTTLRELRSMWEDLRRRILALPTFYNRSLLERCMLLSELTVMPELSARQRPVAPGRSSSRRSLRLSHHNRARSEETTLRRYERDRNHNDTENDVAPDPQASNSNTTTAHACNSNTPSTSNTTTPGTLYSNTPSISSTTIAGTAYPNTSNSNNPSTSGNAAVGPSTAMDNTNDTSRPRGSRAARAQRINRQRLRLQQTYRWRGDDDARRRDVFPPFRLSQLRSRQRNNAMRSLEQNATRHVIRTRAMKILSVMFNMMMMCLEERGLSQLIINMLKTLKKALALTCFMMMSNRNMPRDRITAPAGQDVDSADVVRIQNVDNSEPINVDDNVEDPHSPRVTRFDANADELEPSIRQSAVTSGTQTENSPIEPLPSPETNSISESGMEWSHRLAVQIAAANRNNSSTAKRRRDMYLETRRQKALHRTNPTAHPFVMRRLPPLRSHRIPALRTLPPALLYTRLTPRSPPSDPVAGPSSEFPRIRNTENRPIGRDARENFIRLAHIRLRTAARNRFRRLQTIRLYTPSSVRELFALHDFQAENRPEDSGMTPAEVASRNSNFHAMLVSQGLLRVNDIPPEASANPRLPRIHEYLQPIILAQNAMVVDDEEGGGGGGPPPAGAHGSRRLGSMAGLLDAGIISEALPAPSHRVQAWDFTSGAAPDIADNSKNVVVQRCRIHNDASIDISKDGRLLVALLPVPRLRNTNNWLGEYHVGVYSLEWPRLGQCLHTAVLEQSAVSVALSPTARYLAVGLGSRRFTSSHSRTNIIALLYKLDPLESTSRTGLSPMKELEQYWEHGFTSLNCLRWAPQPGQGLVYANNTGQLIIMS